MASKLKYFDFIEALNKAIPCATKVDCFRITPSELFNKVMTL